jgi:hypothetical protein
MHTLGTESRCTANLAKHVVRQEIKSGQMVFTDWDEFPSEFMLTFCPENKAMAALMRLESDHYFQCRHNINTYIDEFQDLIDMSGYTDSITIVLKFCQGLSTMTQDRIAESGTDMLWDNAYNGWYQTTC